MKQVKLTHEISPYTVVWVLQDGHFDALWLKDSLFFFDDTIVVIDGGDAKRACSN